MNGSLPPMIRRRDVIKMFGGKVSVSEIEAWEDCGLVRPFQKTKRAHKWFRTHELEKIKNGT